MEFVLEKSTTQSAPLKKSAASEDAGEEMFLEGKDSLLYRTILAEEDLDPVEETTYLPTPIAEAIVQDSAGASPHPPPPSTASTSKSFSPAKTSSRPGRGRGAGRGRGRGQVRAGITPASRQTWNNTDVEDIVPTPLAFTPARQTGPQHSSRGAITPMDYFKLFFTDVVLATLLDNINNFGLRQCQDKWTAICLADLYSFLAMVIYMGFVKLPELKDYWRQHCLYDPPFPPSVISREKFETISRFLHLAASDADEQNQIAKGTAAYDHLAKIKPLYDEMLMACKKHFQPEQSISIDERMVASKQYRKSKPTKWGYRLLVLADSVTGYTWNFFADTGKGLSYESVMKLLDFETLGTGYHLYVDNIDTSPQLFKDLLRHSVGACGTVRPSQVGFPKAALNDFTRNESWGNVRWIRDEDLLFVKWKDMREVVMCSTLHTASCKERAERRMKLQGESRGSTLVQVPIPDTIKDCNKHMEGVDLWDALNHYYTALHKTNKWYKTFFFHFLDIAIGNAYIIYKAHQEEKEGRKGSTTTMTQKLFKEALIQELADHGSPSTSTSDQPKPAAIHLPMYFTEGQDIPKEQTNSVDSRNCKLCNKKTPVGCTVCQVPLCLVPTRNCFRDYHQQQL